MARVPIKPLAVLLSIVPGVGHYYLGAMSRGLQFMLLFFGSFFLIDIIPGRILPFWIPVIWFYCLFDALQVADQRQRGDVPLLDMRTIKRHLPWIGLSVALLGLLLLFDNIVPLKEYLQWEDTRSLFLAALLVIVGVAIILDTWKRGKDNNQANTNVN